jgi:tetratricopeptide (TPR) repeat protein
LEQAALVVRPLDATWVLTGVVWGLAQLAFWRCAPTAPEYITEALALAEKSQRPEIAVCLRFSLAEQDLLEGKASEALSRLRSAEAPITHEFYSDPQSGCLPPLAWAYLETAAEADAESLLSERISQATTNGDWLLLVGAYRVRAMLATKRGAWEEAKQALDAALQLCGVMPYPYGEVKARYEYGRLFIAQGNPGRAREQYEQALAICERLGEGLYRPHIARALAELDD